MEATMEMSLQRMADLERRVMMLEERTRSSLWQEETEGAIKAQELSRCYGEYVDKTAAARILGVTRATVYAMLSDGRITGGCGGRRVSVSSIARYMTRQREGGARRSTQKSRSA